MRGDAHGRRAREVGEAGVGPFFLGGFCRRVRVVCSSDDLCVRGHWLQGLPSILPSCGDPRNKRSKTHPFVHMEVRGCSLQTTSTSRKHADSKQRRLAAVAPQKSDGINSLGAPSAHCREPGRVSRTRRASLQQGRTEGILCLADTEVNQKPRRTPPRVCRQTFGAFARDMVHIIPSRSPQLAGSSGSVPSENPGGAWNPEPASPT